METPSEISLPSVVGKLSNWKTYVIYALLATVALQTVWILWQRGNVSKQETEIVELKIARDVAKGNEDRCRLAFDDQSKRIVDAGAEFEQSQKKVNDLNKWIRENIANGTIHSKSDGIRNQNTPENCQEALEFMQRNIP